MGAQGARRRRLHRRIAGPITGRATIEQQHHDHGRHHQRPAEGSQHDARQPQDRGRHATCGVTRCRSCVVRRRRAPGSPRVACPRRARGRVRETRSGARAHAGTARTRRARAPGTAAAASAPAAPRADRSPSNGAPVTGDADRQDPSRARRNGQIASSQSSPVMVTASGPVPAPPVSRRPAAAPASPPTRPCSSASWGVDRALIGAIIRAAVARDTTTRAQRKDPGDDLFSRGATPSVSSALESLTSVFGMGTGVASPLESPGSCACVHATGCTARTRPHT